MLERLNKLQGFRKLLRLVWGGRRGVFRVLNATCRSVHLVTHYSTKSSCGWVLRALRALRVLMGSWGC